MLNNAGTLLSISLTSPHSSKINFSKTLRQLELEYGTKPADCYAYIGTCIDECSFEVNADVADHFASAHKRWDEGLQKYFVDLKAANRAQLLEAGVPVEQVEVSPYSTVLHNEHFFSYRKEKGVTGRMLNLIGFLTAPF